MKEITKIAPAEGKLGILIPGMGAVTTTFIAGVEAVHDLVRSDRGLAYSRRSPPDTERCRMRAREERSGHLAQPDLCLRGAEIGCALRQRRAASHCGYSGPDGPRARMPGPHLR